ncbi:rho guanine nucleotide exchange factor 37 isoform X1 [Hypomesus transpacificus]|uniref:rho guanine nucleotide exchange factor 37 isoform X1 n=1 Tax=Hypomesus transpacificus TaxID=137520 RepID=UPI001F0832E0|nr:rho guanine nucleotide exchange factor 37 isoform X1 [Hypomesus transpacificus]XP_046896906.1 rho guanine nucleotide exchange factor 37 isoform X1 [Hypomesus transpacificus]XP_046897690.1 rho guanine nucleotide exchange factor 37 isoform X1 [Hypomesus transpacificus]XP_046898493.1 rho guanine nucleotide exchange factor 37 isoform X1 [Hypomesus transpacificus]XP_046899191.1 rho guanine nucleotide exchange factor 37 isoform X1 [Hypomesus transpacificus]
MANPAPQLHPPPKPLPRTQTALLNPVAETTKETSRDTGEEREGSSVWRETAGEENRREERTTESEVSVSLEEPAGSSEREESLSEEAEAKEMAARERELQRQLLAIQELVHTERNYLRQLQVCTVTIRANLHKIQPPLANLDSMFLYIEEVMKVSSRLLSLLDQHQGQLGEPLYLKTLCDAFLSLSTEIEAAYKEYLANYSNVTTLENSYKQKEGLWNEVVRVIKSSAPEVNATSLSFFLVMPVQRIARYPLLLQTIKKHTEPGHFAYDLLENTAHTAIALNCKINEYKRFREVADKYKKTETLTIKDKIVRLNSHSIAKKTARLSQFIKHETGIAAKLVDEEFDALEGFFYMLESGITDLYDNVENFVHNLQRFLACRPEEFDLDLDGEKSAISYKEISTALRQWILPTFEHRMRSLIFKPLCALRDLLVGPRNLIRKRLDKLLDYELLEAKGSLSYEEQAVANTYRTINTLLLNELPVFNGLALQLLWGMLETFSCLHRDLASDMKQLFQGFAQQLPHSALDHGAFWEWADAEVLQGVLRLDSLCRNVQDQLNAPIVQPLSPSSQRRLKLLTEKHGPGKIYQVSSLVVGSRDLDLSLGRGELVAILSQMDTRGDRRRWLVDAGGPRGYVPASKLLLYHQVCLDPPTSPHLPLPTNQGKVRRHSYAPDARPMAGNLNYFQVFAAYDFTARTNHEVSLAAGEPIRVLEQQDKRGNPEWSLVEARGKRGYVPSNFLAFLPSPALTSSACANAPCH